jgi:hypothetical protein
MWEFGSTLAFHGDNDAESNDSPIQAAKIVVCCR